MAETIFAQASGAGRAGVAVVRISGRHAFTAATALAGTLPEARRAGLRVLRDPATAAVLDEALVLAFPGPESFTGEDTVELQVHGSVAVVRALSAALAAMPGVRLAQPGEFTRRALLNGRLDLAQVEALGDLLEAETAMQQQRAVAALRGRVGELVAGWKVTLTEVLALVEASIDFADEELPPDVLAPVAETVAAVIAGMEREIAGAAIAERLRAGFEVAIVGRPNVGKSTLLNALAGRDAALTSSTPGTTRDVIEVRMDLDGLPLTVLDTAGLRDAGEEVEAAGIARARQRAESADVRVFLVADREEVRSLGVPRREGDLVLLAKGDLDPGPGRVSGLTGYGIEAMLAELAERLGGRVAGAGAIGHVRQRDAVAEAVAALRGGHSEIVAGEPRLELVAEDVRSALRSLDFLMGRVDVEAVLDVIFARFCLGK